MSIQTVSYRDWEAAIAAAETFVGKARGALFATKSEDRDIEARHEAIRAKVDHLPPYPNEHAGLLRASAKRASMDLTRALVAVRRPRR